MTTFHLPESVPKKVKPKGLHERESDIEEHLREVVKAHGGVAYKFTSPQRRSVPDRLVLLDTKNAAEMLRKLIIRYRQEDMLAMSEEALALEASELIAAGVHFVELKATGQKPTKLQEREHAKLRARGFKVLVIDSKAEVDWRYSK